MNTKLNIILALSLATVTSCLSQDALSLQGPDSPEFAWRNTEEYYAGVREWKKSDHVLSFGFYAAWHKPEGSYGEIDSPASYGLRLRGLPDSLDVVDLWMGIPGADPEDPDYCPIAQADMQFIQKNLGTKFVGHEDASHNQVFRWGGKFADGTEIDSLYFDIKNGKGTIAQGHGKTENDPAGGGTGTSQQKIDACKAYAHLMVDRMYKNNMDGVDIDYEPNDGTWTTTVIGHVAKEVGALIGPKGADTTRIFMINFFSSEPGSAVNPYINLLVNQCYAWQIGTNPSSWLGRRPSWCPANKFILCDSFGSELDNSFANGSKKGGMPVTYQGQRMYSLEAMARAARDNGLGGFGAYYMCRNYPSLSGVPFHEFRRNIQVANDKEKIIPPYYVE